MSEYARVVVENPTPEWFDGKLPCRDLDPEDFFPKRGANHAPPYQRAIAACGSCPFKSKCLVWQLDWEEGYGEFSYVVGLYGDLPPRARRRLLTMRTDARAAFSEGVEE